MSENKSTVFQKNGYVCPMPSTPLRFLWYASQPHKKFLIATVISVTVAEILSTSIPYILKSIIDGAHGVLTGAVEISHVWYWVCAYPIFTAGMFLCWRISGFYGMEWAARANATAYKVLFTYLTQHSHSFFTDRFAGSISNKLNHASDGTETLTEAFVWNYYPTALSLILTIFYISSSSTLAALIFLVLILVLIPINILLVRKRRPHVVAYSAQSSKTRGYAIDAITNMSTVRQFSRKEYEQKIFLQHVLTMRALNVKQWKMSEWGLLINNIIIVAVEACMLVIAIKLWIAESISIGELVMIASLLMGIQGALVFIGSSMNSFIRSYGDIEEGLSEILEPHEIVDAEGAGELVVIKGRIEWKDANFQYENIPVFSHFNLRIEPGERVGLVGSSGAGKTTFVSLLLRQHELNGGEIFIDCQNIASVTQDSLRANIAVVPQEPSLFHRTIKENISYGKQDATQEEIISVAKKAFAHEFISRLPEGYDTLVGERGVKLSGGQRQRIAIARAMLKDSPILVLDEATSALDSESEVVIQKALHELMEGKTVIAIAHRLSTLREMDRIIVLEQGRIVEDGSHRTLARRKGGIYARLWEHQAGGFLQE